MKHTGTSRVPDCFAEALKRERIRRNDSVANMCKHMAFKHDEYMRWEAGEAAPNSDAFSRIAAWHPPLRRFYQDILCMRQMLNAGALQVSLGEVAGVKTPNLALVRPAAPSASSAPPAPPPDKPPPAANLPRWNSFGQALTYLREAARMTQSEIAEMLSITRGAVSIWENNGSAPTLDNYDQLLELFPELAQAPKPAVRNIPKPPGNVKQPEEPMAPPIIPAPQQPSQSPKQELQEKLYHLSHKQLFELLAVTIKVKEDQYVLPLVRRFRELGFTIEELESMLS